MSMYIRAPLEDGPEVRVLEVAVSGKLVVSDYSALSERAEELIANHGKINLLVELSDFQGWTAGAAWEDFKFGVEHFDDIDRMALVGDSVWEEGMAYFVKPFTTAEVKYFDRADADQAYEWVHQENETIN